MTNYNHRSQDQHTPKPLQLDPAASDNRFNTSRSPRNKRVQRWAKYLLSPKDQTVHVPSWYTDYMRAIEVTAQDTPPDPSSNVNQPPPASRYYLRRRQNTKTSEPAPPARQVSQTAQTAKHKKNNNKTQSKKGIANNQKNKKKTKKKKKNNNSNNNNDFNNHDNNDNNHENENNNGNGDNDNNDNNNKEPSIENPVNTSAILMEPPRKRTRTVTGYSIAGSQSAAGLPSDSPSTIRPPRRMSDVALTSSTRDRQTERFSGVQRLMHLKTQSPPFAYWGSIMPEGCPKPVIEFCRRLQRAAFARPDEIVPASMKDQIMEEFPSEYLPDSLFTPANSDHQELSFARKQYEWVKGLYNTMSKCNGIGVGMEEVTWYVNIANALNCFQSGRPTPNAAGQSNGKYKNLGNLTATLCTTSEVIAECLPHHPRTGVPTQSARVDLLIGYTWTEQPLMDFYEARAEWPLPFTPLKKIEHSVLGAVPIEVKNASGDAMDARYQLALCSSAMLRLRQKWASSQKKEFNPDKPPIVVSLSVHGHVWSYYVMYLGKPRNIAGVRANPQTTQDYHNLNLVPRMLLGPFVAGHTTGLLPTFYLFRFFEELRKWLVEEWAPEVFEELAGIPFVDQSSVDPLHSASGTPTPLAYHG